MARTILIDRGMDAILRMITSEGGKYIVDVGILDGTVDGNGAPVAQYAAVNEFGEGSVPARPAFAIAFDENEDDLMRELTGIARTVRSRDDLNQKISRLGVRHEAMVKNVISGRDILPKLSRRRVAEKHGSEKTLIDTGVMLNSVSHARE